jgi:glycosyltransferase involved in cell wall biosynthesis
MPTGEVIIDVTRLLGRFWKGKLPTGIDRVGLEYLKYFQGRSVAMVRFRSWFFFLKPELSKQLIALLLQQPAYYRFALIALLCRRFWQFNTDASGQVLLNTGHTGLEHESYSRWISALAVKPVYFIHDLIPISHPQFSRDGEPEKHRHRMRNALVSAKGILTNSADTLNHLRDYAIEQALPMPASAVALLASAPLPEFAGIRPFQAPYFLVLGTIEGRKNHALLLSIWRKLPLNGPKLVIVGQRGWQCQEVFDALDNDPELQDKVIELPRCSDGDLANYLKYANALLFPSFVEGFGMPLLEAISFGTPVIASNLPVFHEIAGDIPDYLDSADTKAWHALIVEYNQTTSIRRSAQLSRLKHFVAPTWSQHFVAVEALLKKLS